MICLMNSLRPARAPASAGGLQQSPKAALNSPATHPNSLHFTSTKFTTNSPPQHQSPFHSSRSFSTFLHRNLLPLSPSQLVDRGIAFPIHERAPSAPAQPSPSPQGPIRGVPDSPHPTDPDPVPETLRQPQAAAAADARLASYSVPTSHKIIPSQLSSPATRRERIW